MSKKIDRALYGPSWSEVIIGAVLSAVIGAVLAMVWLATKPVEKVRELPKEPVAGLVYYIEGSANSTQGRQWSAKRQSFIQGTSVTVTEQELNTALKTLETDAAKAKKPEEKTEPGMITPGALNFRIHDNLLQIGAPIDLLIYGMKTQVQVVAQGTFERRGDKFAFDPQKIYVGSCQVERLPIVSGMVMGKLLAAANLPTDLTEAWGRLADVSIEGSELKLVMP
ncbi:MAG: hypothetical protein K9M98_13870 [Cephaloticoccus sp.]|nr:hypothetical protein [Cephaloticoccus sp.]MCF7761582.1 hypothetical protein [Cephaloticoccus sp.]